MKRSKRDGFTCPQMSRTQSVLYGIRHQILCPLFPVYQHGWQVGQKHHRDAAELKPQDGDVEVLQKREELDDMGREGSGHNVVRPEELIKDENGNENNIAEHEGLPNIFSFNFIFQHK